MDRTWKPATAAAFLLATGTVGCARSSAPAAINNASPERSATAMGEVSEAPPSATCPASSFPKFLEAFAGDPAVRSRYTDEVVHVTDWKNVDETEQGTEVVDVPRASYTGFTLTFRNGAFHHVASDGSVDPAVESPTIGSSASGYDVSDVYGMSEGNSWHFASRAGCWFLTADPEPSSP